jgi:lipoyl(octanoyl) transferase
LELNCNADLREFDRIVPCGIADAGTTSLSDELGRDVPVDEAYPLVEQAVQDALDGRLELAERNIPRHQPAAAGVTLALDPSLR